MDWILPFPAPAVRPVPCQNLPTGLVRTLLSECGISFGARVLEIGPANTRLEQQLLYLGCKRESRDTTNIGDLSALLGNLPEQAYDLVLLRAGIGERQDLLDASALNTTARLLAAVRPRGHLIHLNRREPAWEAGPVGHLRSCFARHLACFGGTSRVYSVYDGPANWRTWSWLAGRRPRSGYLVARLTADGTQQCSAGQSPGVGPERHPSEFCCLWARQFHGHPQIPALRIAPPLLRRVA